MFQKIKWMERDNRCYTALVPTQWISKVNDKDYLMWPSNSQNVQPLIRKQVTPQRDWQTFLIIEKFGEVGKQSYVIVSVPIE